MTHDVKADEEGYDGYADDASANAANEGACADTG